MECALFLVGVMAVTFAVIGVWPQLQKRRRARPTAIECLMGLDTYNQRQGISISEEVDAAVMDASMWAIKKRIPLHVILERIISYYDPGRERHPKLRRAWEIAVLNKKRPRGELW
jgi:hypothetical protein